MIITFKNLIENLIPRILVNYDIINFGRTDNIKKLPTRFNRQFLNYKFTNFEHEVNDYFNTNNYFQVLDMVTEDIIYFDVLYEHETSCLDILENNLSNIIAECKLCKIVWAFNDSVSNSWICKTKKEEFKLNEYPFYSSNELYGGSGKEANERRIGTIQESKNLLHSCPICGDWTLMLKLPSDSQVMIHNMLNYIALPIRQETRY